MKRGEFVHEIDIFLTCSLLKRMLFFLLAEEIQNIRVRSLRNKNTFYPTMALQILRFPMNKNRLYCYDNYQYCYLSSSPSSS